MKTASSSYYSRDRDSQSESTRTPYIQEDDSMMTYYTDESVERRQNKKLTYDTFVPMESDSSRESTSASGRRGWRKQGLSIDTRNDKDDHGDDDEAEEVAKKTLSPGMVDTENIRNIRRQRLARMARNRNERQEAEEDEENYSRRNNYKTTNTPNKPSRYMPSPIVEESSERGFSVSPRKNSRYGSDRMAHDESPSKYYGSSSKRPYSGSRADVLSPQSRPSPQKAIGAFEAYTSPTKMKSPNYRKTSYNFDFPEEDDESYNNASTGGSSNETRASGERNQEDEREDEHQSRRYETDAREGRYVEDHHRRGFEYQERGGDSSTLDAKPSDGSDMMVYPSSPKNQYERKEQEQQGEEADPYHVLKKQESDDRIEHHNGYELHRDERRDEAREDYDTTPYHTSNHPEYQGEELGRSNLSPSKGRDMRRRHPNTHEESQIVSYQGNGGNDNMAIGPTEGRRHTSQNSERWRYAPEASPRESMQTHMAQAYMSTHGYQNPQYAAMANHNARHALMRRYGSNHVGPMRSPMSQQFGPMLPPTPKHPTSMKPSTPRQHSSMMHTQMPEQYQIQTHTTQKVVIPDSGRGSGKRMSPLIEDHSYLSVESHSILNTSVNTGAGCQAIQCQSVMTKIWTCGAIADVDDADPRTKILEGLAGESMGAFSLGTGGKPQKGKALEAKVDQKGTNPHGNQNDSSFQNGVIGAFEKISAEAQFLGAEATNIFSDVINGNFNGAELPEKQKNRPVSVKSYGDDSSCSSDSSNNDTHFDIGAPQPSEKQAKRGEKKSEDVQKKAQLPEAKADATQPKSPSGGIYASVVKSKNRRKQLAQLQKGRKTQAQKALTSTKQDTEDFATGTDQLRDVYKHLFDTMNSPTNPLYVENSLQRKNENSVVIEELADTKETVMDGETVFHSFDKGQESGNKRKIRNEKVAEKKTTPETTPVAEKEKAAVSGILSALENTLAQMMVPESLSQANVEESVVGSVGGETKSVDEQDSLIMDKKMQKTTVTDLDLSTDIVLQEEPKSVAETKATETADGVKELLLSQQVMVDLLKKTQEQKAVEAEEKKKMRYFEEVKTVSSMTDADIEAELTRMMDDDSVVSSEGPQLDNYDGPTDDQIITELMEGAYSDDGQDVVKSMFDDATVDFEDDQTDVSSVLKPKVHFSNEVSKLKIISEDTSDDLESLKRAAKALEEAIERASAKELYSTSGERSKHAGENERPGSPDLSFATAMMEEVQEPSSWMGKIWKK